MAKKTRKNVPCPKCCPAPYKGTFLLEWDWVPTEEDPEDEKLEQVWVCTNCGHQLPHKPRGHRLDRMTKIQERLIKEIPQEAIRDAAHGDRTPDQYELVNLKTELLEHGPVAISFGVRWKGYAPNQVGYTWHDRYQIFIGRNGGLSSHHSKKLKSGKYRYYWVRGRAIYRHRQDLV